MRKSFPLVSVIIPVKNEEANIKDCLLSLKRIDWPKEKLEVILVDGGSTDRTVELGKKFGARVAFNKKGTVAPGRNVGYKMAKGEIIAFTDADCRVDKDWLKNAFNYFKNKKVAGVGGPNITPGEETNFGKAVGWIFNQGLFAAGSLHARVIDKVCETKSLPGCNSIYKRGVLEKVMPQDENLLTCDETEMNYRIRDLGYKLLYTPDVFVYHFRRPTLTKLYWQMYRYAIGRLQFGKKRLDGINIFHIIVGMLLPVFLLFILFSVIFYIDLLRYFFVFFSILIFLIFLKSFIENKSFLIAINSTLAVMIICFSWSLGFIRELILPLKDVRGK